METNKGDGQSMKRLFKLYIFAAMASGLILFPSTVSNLAGSPLLQDETGGKTEEYETEEEYEELPDDFECPVCGASKDDFERI